MSEELKLRIISAIVLAIVVLAAAWMGGLYFNVLSQIIALLIYYEWCRITGIARNDLRGYALGWLLVVVVASTCIFGGMANSVVFLAGSVVVAAVFSLIQKQAGWLPGGILYAGLSGMSLAYLRADDLAGLIAIAFLFAVVWGTDIAAYFVGRAVGGPKLAPRISPGKTWSGAIGGTVVGVVLSALVISVFFRSPGISVLLFALVLSVLSQIGDLFESHIKRRFGVKDSSHLIPGHGGVMDRVDGLVFAGFGAFFYAAVKLYLNQDGVQSLGALLLGLG